MNGLVGHHRPADAGIPWRYAVPRKGYFRLLRAAKACPEIRPHIDREAWMKGIEAASLLPHLAVLVIAAPMMAVGAVGLMLTQVVPRPADLRERRFANAQEANRLVLPHEVKRRLGETP